MSKSIAAPRAAKKRSSRSASQDESLGLLGLPQPPQVRPVRLDEPLLTVVQTAELLSVARSTVYHLVGTGELPHRHVGRRIRFYKPDLEDYLERQAPHAA